jgi:hypothetical protein
MKEKQEGNLSVVFLGTRANAVLVPKFRVALKFTYISSHNRAQQ